MRMRSIATAVALTAGFVGQAWSQEADDPVSSSVDTKPNVVEEMIVTATKREESLQEVPLAVSAFGAEQLKIAGVEDTRQLMALAPSLNLNATTSDSAGVAIRLRGLGSESINPGLESSVATFVDGVYRSRSNLSLSAIPGIDRIEVLRGPQGTLFGKNTSSGAINVYTRLPSFAPSVATSASFGNYDYQQYVLGATGPLMGQQLAGRIDAAYTMRDGWLSDFSTGQEYRDKDQLTVRGQLLWKREYFDARLILDGSRYDQRGADTYAVQHYDPSSRALLGSMGFDTTPGLDGLHNTITPYRESRERNEQWGASLEAHWELQNARVTSVTGYRDWRNPQAREVDYAEADLVYIPFGKARQAFKTFTQELRLDGARGDLDWLVGGFFSQEDLVANYGYRVGRDLEAYIDALLQPSTGRQHAVSFYTGLPVGASLPEGAGVGRTQFDQDATSYSAFTHNTYHVTDRFSVTGGLRYSHERKSVDAVLADTFNPGCESLIAQGRANAGQTPVSGTVCLQLWDPRYDGRYSTSKTENEWSGVLTAAFDMSDSINSYVTYSHGYKAGGFIIDPSGFKLTTTASPDGKQLAFDAELADNYELGLKTQFFGRRLTINSAAFLTEIEDYQLSYNTGTALLTTNVPKVRSKGMEIESSFQPHGNIRGSLGVTYADARYGRLPASLGLPAAIQALQGQRLANAPLWTGTASLGWDGVIVDGAYRLFAYVDARVQSDVRTERTLRVQSGQDGYTTANMRIGFGHPDDAWTVELWVRNLTDERFFVASILAPFQGATLVGVPGEPRMYGVTLRARW